MYRVLLVEDDASLRFIYSKMKAWTECGFTVAGEASNGQAALDMLKKGSFDLIFTDIRMPFMDGIELLRALKGSGSEIPCVFASSFDEFEYARQGLILGAVDYLLKPVDQKQLAETLLRVRGRIEEAELKIAPCVSSVLEALNVSPQKDPLVHRIAVYCSEHLYEDMTGEEFAASHNYSKDYFGKLFQQHMGIRFREFVARIKVAHGIELLRTGNYKAYEVSEKLGYANPYSFSKVFKAVTGQTMSEFKSGIWEEA